MRDIKNKTVTELLMDQYQTNATISTTNKWGCKPCGIDQCKACKHIYLSSNIRSSITGRTQIVLKKCNIPLPASTL